MTIKFEKIKAGMTLWDVRRATGHSRWKWPTWQVRIIEVDVKNRVVLASWNHNKADWFSEYQITRFRANRPSEPLKAA